MIIAAYYTRHNTEILFLLAFIAVVAWVLMILRMQIRSRRTRELPYGIRPVTVYENKLDQWPVPGSYEDIMARMAEIGQELHDNLMNELIKGKPKMIDVWAEMKDAWA